MESTSTDAVRRRIVVTGLILGPLLLLLLSNAFIIPDAESMEATFDAMAANPWMLLTESLLEAIGFAIAFASYAGAAHALRSRGGALGTVGAALCMVGILGFTLSASGGLFLYVVAGMPDKGAAFAAGSALAADGVTGTLLMVLMVLGEAGICLLIGGLLRARLVPIWPLLLVLAGVVADNVLGGILASLVADLLLAVASVWVAIALARAPRAAWLGESAPIAAPLAQSA